MTAAADAIFAAALATVELVGPVPESAEAARDHVRKWCDLMKVHDPQLRAMSNEQMMRALERA